MNGAVARPDTIRRANLGLILGLIHRHGAMTRAELTSSLGLSRSTVGALVGDLTDLGVLDEQVPTGGDRAGRPSHVVSPAPGGPAVLAVDVHVDHVTLAAVAVGGTVLRRTTRAEEGPLKPDAVVQAVAGALDELGDLRIAGVGVSVPGTVNRRDGTIEFAPNLEWRHTPLRRDLEAILPTDVRLLLIGNDADLAMLAEHNRGAARGCDDAIYLLGRVGVGAGIIANAVPLSGHDGYAGEFGHNVLDPAGPPCHCGKAGCVETYVGEPALAAAAGVHGGGAAVFAAARAGSQRATDAVATAARNLGSAVAELNNLFNPERVLFGGALAGILELERTTLEDQVSAHSSGSALPELRAAELGDDAILLGAAELVFAEILADPVGTLA